MSTTLGRIVTTAAQIEAAIALGRARTPYAAVSAEYDAVKDMIFVAFESGMVVGFPRKSLQGLIDATPAQLATIEIEGPGTGLVWPKLDVAHFLPGLIDQVFGTRAWMSEIAKRGGSAKTPRKSAAAAINGAKGGRPRKTPVT